LFRIKGVFRSWIKEIFPHFRCTIVIGGVHFIPTYLLLDTGSPFTPITPKDYLRTRLRITPGKEKTCWLAACKFYRIPITQGVEYRFETEDNELKKIEYTDSIFLYPMDEFRDIKQVQAIPSIIGLDFLRKNNLRFFIDPVKEIAYIEGD